MDVTLEPELVCGVLVNGIAQPVLAQCVTLLTIKFCVLVLDNVLF